MKSRRPLHIVLTVLAIISAMVLFVTYGKTIPAGPFDTVRLEQPTVVDSDGEITAVVVSESRRALVLNSSGDLTGIINCETLDSPIDAIVRRNGERKTATVSIALLGIVFLLFSVNTTLVWSMVVVALVAVLCKASEAWKSIWLKAAFKAGVPAGKATSSMLAMRRLTLVAQPFVLSLLLGLSENVAVIVIGFFCALCAAAFFLVAIKSKPEDNASEGESASPGFSEELFQVDNA